MLRNLQITVLQFECEREEDGVVTIYQDRWLGGILFYENSFEVLEDNAESARCLETISGDLVCVGRETALRIDVKEDGELVGRWYVNCKPHTNCIILKKDDTLILLKDEMHIYMST